MKPEFRPKVLLLAYCISPIRGSEYSVGWNHVAQMSKHCDLTVLYGLAGPHMGDIGEVEEYLQNFREFPNVNFIPIIPNILARILNYPNRKGILVYSFYAAYRIWHAQAARMARKLVGTEPFDLVHYLGPIGYREPGFLWKLDKPYVWGPIGGLPAAAVLDGAPRPRVAVLKTQLKNLANLIQLRIARRVPRALARADVVIAATTENREIIHRRFGVEARHIPENAIRDEWITGERLQSVSTKSTKLRLIWIGRLDYRKAPDLLLDALSGVCSKDWHLDIVGTGPLEARVRTIIAERKLDEQVSLHGNIPRAEVFSLLAQCDLHVLTSLNEGNPTVLWEAMAAGVPTLALDHCGMHDTICDQCGVRIPLSNYRDAREQIAAQIERLIVDRDALEDLAKGTLTCKENHMWSRRERLWLSVYEAAIAHRNCTS